MSKNDLANIANLTGHLDSVTSVMFLNSGILTRSWLDKSIKLRELISFSNIATKQNAHSKGVNSLKTG